MLHWLGKTYQQMEAETQRVRSFTWFYNVAIGQYVRPPKVEEFDRFAALFGVTPEQVGLWVAEEWFGITHHDVSSRVRALEPVLDALTDEDAEMIEKLARRLADAK